MARRKMEITEPMEENDQAEPCDQAEPSAITVLEQGFYIMDGSGQLKCKDVRKRVKNEYGVNEFVVSSQPIRLRTIAAAKDFLSCVDGCAVLCVSDAGFYWG